MTGDRPTFLFDGDCAFCSSCAGFIERHIPTRAAVLPWQRADLDALGVTEQQVDESVQWIDAAGVASGPDAIARLLRDAGSFWRPLGVVLGAPPVRWLAWPVYRWISRHRDLMPGGTAACALPAADRH
jgi:predicted DCC family thiol-disulfide oxidoreductase YuxK